MSRLVILCLVAHDFVRVELICYARLKYGQQPNKQITGKTHRTG